MLADGVVYASKDLSADIILDMATLTGAQVGVITLSTASLHWRVLNLQHKSVDDRLKG